MAQPPQATKSTGDEPYAQDQDTSRTTPNPALSSLPLEIRSMILAACVIPSWIKENSDQAREPHWYLSHTVPKSILHLSKQLRTEAFTALSRYPGLTVICNVRADYEIEFTIPDVYPPSLENLSVTPEDYWHSLRRVYLQCKRLHAPGGRKLTLRLYNYYDCQFLLKSAAACLAENVYVATDLWPKWESVVIDVDAMDGWMDDERKENLESF